MTCKIGKIRWAAAFLVLLLIALAALRLPLLLSSNDLPMCDQVIASRVQGATPALVNLEELASRGANVTPSLDGGLAAPGPLPGPQDAASRVAVPCRSR